MKKNQSEYYEYEYGNTFLNNFELPHVKGTAIDFAADFVGGYHQYIFKKSDSPTYKDGTWQSDIFEEGKIFESRCSYQAIVIKVLESVRRMMV